MSATPADPQTVSVVRLHCDASRPAEGRAPLLLGGSLGTTTAMWGPQVTGLGKTFALYPFDHRGHGRSEVTSGPYTIAELAGDVLALMDRLELARAAYCGVSLGGMVGQWLAIHAPERISAAVLISTSAHLPPPENWTGRAAAVRDADTPGVVADPVVGRWFTPDFAAAHPELVAEHRAMIVDTPAEGYAGCCEAIATMDLRDGLSEIAVPTLVIAGAQDPSIHPENGRRIAATIPGARYEEVGPAAHLASVERAEVVNELIRGHLKDPR